MSNINPTYQCLFCSQTFVSAAKKDVHVWMHLATETYEDNRIPKMIDSSKELWNPNHAHPHPFPIQPQPLPPQPQPLPTQQQPLPPPPPPTKPKQRSRSKVSCNLCGGMFHRYALYRHRRDVHNHLEISCELCSTKFKSEEYRHRHMQYKHGMGKNLTCGTCSKTFRSEVKLLSHQCESADGTMAPIDPGKEYWNANYADDQKPKRKMEHDRVECEYCGKFFHIYAIYRHRRDVHNPIVCVCQVCNTTFKSREYLNRHLLTKHGIVEASTSTNASASSTSGSTDNATAAGTSNYTGEIKPKQEVDRERVECDQCGQYFHHHALYRHRRDVHNPIEISCEICSTKFKSEEYLHRHMQYKHGVGKNLTCGTCEKTFRSEVKLQSHQCEGEDSAMAPIDPGKEYWNANYAEDEKSKPKMEHDRVECEYCGKFFHIYAIYRHRRDVHNPIVCVCQLCNTTFKSKEYLNRHLQSKHGIVETSASSSASSTSVSGCTNNAAVQLPLPPTPDFTTDEQKPKKKVDRERVECDQCGQYFHHYALYRHRRDVHNPIEISCKICNTKFKSEEYRHRHMQYKHGVGRNLTCGTCNKTFRSNVQLQNHECTLPLPHNLPSNPEPNRDSVDKAPAGITFRCDICGKEFDCDQTLQKHKIVFHSHPSAVAVWNPHWMPPVAGDRPYFQPNQC